MMTAWLLLQSQTVVAESSQPAEEKNGEILQKLPGYWNGEAIITPVGPMDYDIIFHTCSDSTVAGVAKTGASLHYWIFIRDLETLRLRFLSTFNGNRKPIYLVSSSSGDRIIKFLTPSLKFLTLDMEHTDQMVDLRVFHNNQLHVHIRLLKGMHPKAEPLPYHSRKNSCRGTPDEIASSLDSQS